VAEGTVKRELAWVWVAEGTVKRTVKRELAWVWVAERAVRRELAWVWVGPYGRWSAALL